MVRDAIYAELTALTDYTYGIPNIAKLGLKSSTRPGFQWFYLQIISPSQIVGDLHLSPFSQLRKNAVKLIES